MKFYIKSVESINNIPTLHIYVDIEAIAENLVASTEIDFDNIEIFSKNKSIARRYRKADTWITPVTQLIRAILKSMQKRKFNLLRYTDSNSSFTYYIKFQPADLDGRIIDQELQLQIELRDHSSNSHSDGKLSDTFYIKSYFIENTEYPDTTAILSAIYEVLDKLQHNDFSDFIGGLDGDN